MSHYFAHQAIDGRWHTVYRIPGCGSLHSVGEGACEATAKREADRLNRQSAEALDRTHDEVTA